MIRQLTRKMLGDAWTKNNARLAAVNFALILLMFVLSGIMLPFLPAELSILHSGDTVYPLPSILAVWLFPMVALLINVGFIVQKRLSLFNTLVFVLLLVIMMTAYVSEL